MKAKTSTLGFFVLALMAFFSSGGSLHAALESKQPHMTNALHFLQDAQKSEHPLPLLRLAKGELHKASHNKGEFLPMALDYVNKAIAEEHTGDKQKMVGLINAAIAALHSGMAHAH